MSNLLMESIVTLVAEWLSQGEMIKLQGISVLVSVNFKEWQYVAFVDEDDNQVWECTTDEWAGYMYVERSSPAL